MVFFVAGFFFFDLPVDTFPPPVMKGFSLFYPWSPWRPTFGDSDDFDRAPAILEAQHVGMKGLATLSLCGPSHFSRGTLRH